MRERIGTLLALVVVATVITVGPVHPVEPPLDDAAVTEPTREEWRFADVPRLTVTDGAVFDVAGSGQYYDTLELRPSGDRALLVNELSMDDYIAGIAEMPTRWPMEALKAQAVAARTYAWRAIQRATYTHYDICATVACQVFRGADVVTGSSSGPRWREAVDATSDEVLLDADGRPILARYFSTSGGRTYANEEVFPSSGSFDYLVGIDDPHDAVSPLHRWNVEFTRDEFDAIIARGDTLGVASPVASIERLGAVGDPLAQIRVTGVTGATAEVGVVAFRAFVSTMSAQLFPARFPGLRADGAQRLPATMPSSRFAITVEDETVVIDGQGWGHGVGMGQYGAKSRATGGATYDEILAAYYNGLVPTVAGVPDRVRVGMSADLPLQVRGSDTFDLVAGGQVLVDDALGTWQVDHDGDDWVVTAPVGHGLPLDMTATRVTADGRPVWGATTLEASVNTPVVLRLEIRDDAGTLVVDRMLGVIDAGTHRVAWRHDDDEGASVPSGTYHARLVARDRTGAEAGDAATVIVSPRPHVVERPPTGGPPEGGPPQADAGASTTPVGLVVALVVGGVGLLLLLLAFVFGGRR